MTPKEEVMQGLLNNSSLSLEATEYLKSVLDNNNNNNFTPHITNPQDGDILTYDGVFNKWINGYSPNIPYFIPGDYAIGDCIENWDGITDFLGKDGRCFLLSWYNNAIILFLLSILGYYSVDGKYSMNINNKGEITNIIPISTN